MRHSGNANSVSLFQSSAKMPEDFPNLQNDRLLRVIDGKKPVDKSPVWIMRQAGRYLPEFRKVRQSHDFFTICRTPSLACEITLQPIERYEPLFDASIIFSDILVIPQALDMEVQMKPGVGPHFPDPLHDPNQVADLAKMLKDEKFPYSLVQEKLGYVFDAITLTRTSLDGRVPLFGFCGAPWTVMAYMIEGGGSKTFSKAKRWLWSYPKESHLLLDIVTNVSIAYLTKQIEAGAQIVQVFDSWAGELSPQAFKEFAFPYLRKISVEVKKEVSKRSLTMVPMVVFAKGAHYAIEELVDTQYDVIGIDWTMDPRLVKSRIRNIFKHKPSLKRRICLQGNMDPTILYAPPDYIREQAGDTIEKFLLEEDGAICSDIGYICNLGHGIQPEVPTDNVQVFLETVDKVSRRILK